jgi:hypothetical protein
VNPDSRNTTIVAFLIASMTLGAGALLWLEPPARGWDESSLLSAESGRPIEHVVVEYLAPGEPVVPGDYDCLVFPDGECEWRAAGGRLQLLVVGTDTEVVEAAQARALLMVLGNLSQGRRDVTAFVQLHPDSDARLVDDLSPQAHALTDLLVRKGIVR